VNSCLVASPASRALHPRRYPGPFPERSGGAARGHGGRGRRDRGDTVDRSA
jgi:hypothetical protein